MIEHTIYKEFIDKIAELSDGIYPIITDLDNDMSYVPEKTADFFGLEPGEHTCLFEQLCTCVNDIDLPEYRREIRYRLNGEKLDDIFYVRMGKHTKEYMMGFYSDIFAGDDGHRYHVLVLRNENTLPDIDPYTYLYGQSKFERDINGYIMENRSVAMLGRFNKLQEHWAYRFLILRHHRIHRATAFVDIPLDTTHQADIERRIDKDREIHLIAQARVGQQQDTFKNNHFFRFDMNRFLLTGMLDIAVNR